MLSTALTPPNPRDATPITWAGTDTLRAALWFVAAILARAPLVGRIEGVLDHDQSVVGLMALDIAAGRRFPIFFDGQRYMGAVEAYIAAGFVRLFGHAPAVIALAPLLAFGLFAASQYCVWRLWRDRSTGNIAALLTVASAPMFALWGIVPRGGYIEFLAWALPTLAVYRSLTTPGRPPLAPWKQAGWGFLLAFGYFLNPLSLTVYATLGFDWTFVRHGEDLRRERPCVSRMLDGRFAGPLCVSILVGYVSLLAAFCHVDPSQPNAGFPYVVFGGTVHGRVAVAAAAIAVISLLGFAALWSKACLRLMDRLREQPWTLLGVIVALFPMLLHGVLVSAGLGENPPSLPIWIAAPWKAAANLGRGASVLGVLLGCDPRAMETVLLGQGVEAPHPQWLALTEALTLLSPLVVCLVFLLVGLAVQSERGHWSRVVRLGGNGVSTPVGLLSTYLAVAIALFSLQGTSPNASAVRYLVPLWVALPGLLACGLRLVPGRASMALTLVLVSSWGISHLCLWADMGHEASARPLAVELEKRGVRAIVASTPVALIVANLSHGNVGAVEFRPIWPRLGCRYLSRFSDGKVYTCVVDRRFPWATRGEGGWAPEQDLGRHLKSLALTNPGKVRESGVVGPFEIWEVELPMNLVLGEDEKPSEGDAGALAFGSASR